MSHFAKVIRKEQAKAHDRKDNRRSFTGRNYWLYVLIAFVVLPIGTIISAGTEIFNYWHTWAAGLDEAYRWVPVLLLAILTNSLIIMLGKGIVDDIREGVFSSPTYDQATFTVKALAFVGIFYFSVTQSLEGAPLLRVHLQEQRARRWSS